MIRTEQLSRLSNLMCIYYHDTNIPDNVLRQIKIHLYKYFNCVRIFNKMEDLTAYLASKLVIRRIVFITSSYDEKEAVAIERLVKRRSQFQAFYRIKLEHHASSTLPDLTSMRSMTEKIFDNIINDLRRTEQVLPSEENIADVMENVIDELPPLLDTFKSISAQSSLSDLNKESLKFLLFQSLIEAFIRKPYEPEDLKHMWNLCFQDYKENPREATKIRQVEANYKQEEAIYYYTQNTCLFRLVNRAFRLEDIERIFRFRCYIADLHQQLEQRGNNQRPNQNQNTKTFFRGKRYSADVVQQFQDNIGHLISINGILSTSENYDISTIFCGLDEKNHNYQSVIFEINIDNTTLNLIRPYANISEISAFPHENEVLFFMGFVWKLESMIEMLSNTWYIELQSCADYDSQLIQYIEESKRNCTYSTIGNILKELGDHANADNFYRRMLEDKKLPKETLGHLYFNIAMLADDRGAYLDALCNFRKAEKLIKRTPNHSERILTSSHALFAYNVVPSRVLILNNMGRIHLKNGKYQLAQDHFEAALREPGPEVERATVLNNYGLLEFQRGNNGKARDYIIQAVQLARNDACCSEFKHTLDLILKHLTLEHAQANAE
jgi:tetratricopeptide (TPR) repeat protein